MKLFIVSAFLLILFSTSNAYASSSHRNFASDSADMVFTELPEENPKFSLDALNAFAYISDQVRIISVLRLVGVIQALGIDQNSYYVSDFTKNDEWIDKLIENGELSPTYAKVLTFFTGKTQNCMDTTQQGVCYSSNGNRALLLVKLTYGPTNRKCGNDSAFYLWDSKSGGKTVCLTPKTLSI